jgi:hypothetical protein
MALIDKLARDLPLPPNGEPHIANHTFSAAIWFLSKGEITRAQVIAGLGLTPTDEIQLDQISTFYGTLSSAEKGQFHNRVEAAGILLEGGYINRAKYKTLLGLP